MCFSTPNGVKTHMWTQYYMSVRHRFFFKLEITKLVFFFFYDFGRLDLILDFVTI